MTYDLRHWLTIVMETHDPVPAALASLARQISGRSYEAAKRVIVSKTGSIKRGERFADDVADAVFLRLQRTAQVGQYASEAELQQLGRDATRLTGPGTITLYRAAPNGIRPGDFAASSPDEARFYTHGGNTIQRITVPKTDVISIKGSMGGGQEFVYLPVGHVAPVPVEYFASFREFYDRVN